MSGLKFYTLGIDCGLSMDQMLIFAHKCSSYNPNTQKVDARATPSLRYERVHLKNSTDPERRFSV